MKIGFITENYHTEVLDYLFELFSDENQYEMVLYNDGDNYLNWNLYEKKYNNLTRKNIHTFLPDLNNDYCEKFFMITYENIFGLKTLLSYREKIIIICHSEKNIAESIYGGFEHITLTPTLLMKTYKMNYKWMLPITKNYRKLDEIVTTVKNKKSSNGDIIKIMSIGAFEYNNKDVEKIKSLLEHKDIELHIFLMTMTDLVKEIDEQYSNVFIYEKNSTENVLKNIEIHNIQYVLFTPKQDSDFLSNGKWSGCISFAYSNNIPLILPETISKNNKFYGCVTYEKDDDIYNKLVQFHNQDVNKYIGNIYKFKELNWDRNRLLIDVIMGFQKYNIFFTNYGVICVNDESSSDAISKDDYISHEALKKLYGNNNCEDVLVLNIGSKYGIENLMKSDINKSLKIYSIEKNLELCKLQKKTNILNLCKNVKIFNNIIGQQNIVKNDVDIITIDSVLNNENHNKIIIYVNCNIEIDEILKGCKKTVVKYKPMFVFNKTIELKCCKILFEYGYHSNVFDNKLIFTIE